MQNWTTESILSCKTWHLWCGCHSRCDDEPPGLSQESMHVSQDAHRDRIVQPRCRIGLKTVSPVAGAHRKGAYRLQQRRHRTTLSSFQIAPIRCVGAKSFPLALIWFQMRDNG